MGAARQFVLAAIFATAVVTPSAGCASDRVCTAVDCQSGVNFITPVAPPGTAKVERCANGVCSAEPFSSLALKIDSDTRITGASVTYFAGDGRVLLTASFGGDHKVTRIQPNGPGCGPTCYVATFRLTSKGDLVPHKLPTRG